MDVTRGLENFPVPVWPRLEQPPTFQYSPDHVIGAGDGPDPSEVSFPGCSCHSPSCLASLCSCLRYGENYNSSCINSEGNELDFSKPVFECNTMCPCGELCQNRVIQRGLQFRLEVFKTTKKGWGLRTLEFIPKGRFVCEYAGEILDFKEARRRIQLQTSSDPNYIIAVREHFHGEQILETFVDPTYIGNIGRFLNHSCEPNLLMVPVRIDSMVPKLALFADRDICADQELTYDYSGRYRNYLPVKDQEKLQKEESKKPCYCRAKLCTGFLPYDSSLFYKGSCAEEAL
ncbi:histone-lysine N-methyltransferase SETMAR isoform X2 [Elgaria multicarinata webbii]|uniref:histone-lysine N-methyltransferase SETMAR isoform X2 n=1 Tax=Elgaria multicarinata webbii TaxID=159646 RepID=UPI002FCD5A4F